MLLRSGLRHHTSHGLQQHTEPEALEITLKKLRLAAARAGDQNEVLLGRKPSPARHKMKFCTKAGKRKIGHGNETWWRAVAFRPKNQDT
jgi:hypothetical protein